MHKNNHESNNTQKNQTKGKQNEKKYEESWGMLQNNREKNAMQPLESSVNSFIQRGTFLRSFAFTSR